MILIAQPVMQVVATAGDGREAVAQAERMTPDVVIMDISMPGLNGLAATVQLHRNVPGGQGPYAHQACRQQLSAATDARRSRWGDRASSDSRPAELFARRFVRRHRWQVPGFVDDGAGGRAIMRKAATPGPEPTTPAQPARNGSVAIEIAWGNTNKEIASRIGSERENRRGAQGEWHAEAQHARPHRHRALRSPPGLAARRLVRSNSRGLRSLTGTSRAASRAASS